ncbi:MAG: DNA primase [Oscillospiraceae bacterium]|jgi:DNA primase|nr:DNA primase [Oscillospiraceae bacterium]
MPFPESFLQELVERNEISDVVSGYVRLTKRSGANLFGLCPFHNEKTPSFSVSPEKQIYHCFGCGKGGGVINFIMEIENLSYPDAIRFLAQRAGIVVPEDDRDETASRRARMLKLLREAARFFYDELCAPSGEAGREYLARRGISGAMVKRFGLGFAPDSWDSLLKAMSTRGYSQAELSAAGLIKASQKGGGAYDTFRNRLMFPVIDVRGSVVAFSGRILGDGEPKYLNSPETLVFSKSRNLFGLNLAKKSKKGYIILVEGNIDVVALHQAGFESAVASLGTSLTPEQARLISNYTSDVIIAYDADDAGLKAAQRAISILDKLDVKVRVLRMSGAKDPDEYIQKFGAAAFDNLISRSENHIEYRLAAVTGKYELSTDEGRVSFLREAVDFIAALPNTVEREVYSLRVAELGGVSEETIKREVERLRKKKAAASKKQYERALSRPVRAAQPKQRAIRYKNERSAKAEEGVLALLYLNPELFLKTKLAGEEFSEPILGKLYDELLAQTLRGGRPQISLLAEKFSADEISLFTQLIERPLETGRSLQALQNYIDIIRSENLVRITGEQPESDESIARYWEQRKEQMISDDKGYGGRENG